MLASKPVLSSIEGLAPARFLSTAARNTGKFLPYGLEEDSMLVTFTTEAYADITMFGDVGVALLKMMGHSGTVPSAIRAEDVPVALSKLKAAIEAGRSSPPGIDPNTGEPAVSMANRALPLIKLLEAAARDEVGVMWK
jgi:hypothetical protein